MVKLKFKYSLEQANEKLKSITLADFPSNERMKYMATTCMGNTTLYKYLKGECPSIVAANHLIEHIEAYMEATKKANAA